MFFCVVLQLLSNSRRHGDAPNMQHLSCAVATPIETPTAMLLLAAVHLGLLFKLTATVEPKLLSNFV